MPAGRMGAVGAKPAVGPTYEAVVLSDGPVGFWPLTETSGTTANDVSGHGRHGTFYGSPTLADGAIASGLQPTAKLNGSTQYVQVADNDAWSAAGPSAKISFELWFNALTVTAPSQMLLTKYEEWQLRIESDGKGLVDTNVNGLRSVLHATTPTAFPAGTAVHFVGTYDRSANHLEVYVNGTSVATASGGSEAMNNRSHPLQVGRRSDGAGSLFSGRIGYVAVYAAALSASRIAAHYTAGTS